MDEALTQPNGQDNSSFDIKLFPYLPDNGNLRCFTEFDASPGKVVRRTLVLHRQNPSVIYNDGADSVIELSICGIRLSQNY